MAAQQKRGPDSVEAEFSTAPETAVTHMGDENGCGVRRAMIGPQLDVADSFGRGWAVRRGVPNNFN